MTATIIDDETDTIVFDDVDVALPCESQDPCDRLATWKIRVKCCNNMWLLCQECTDEVIEAFAKHKSSLVTCGKCKAQRPVRDFVGSIVRL